MCTVSIVTTAGGFRCIFNRDERLSRSIAHAPIGRRLGERCAVFPVDPDGGGSWIGANDAGLVAMLLNRTAHPARSLPAPRFSRGTIVLGLLEHSTADAACGALSRLAPERFGAFSVLVVQDRCARVITSDDLTERTDIVLVRPVMLTTSSLGDELVIEPRQSLFEQLVLRRSDWIAGQEVFHRHQWAERPEVSVVMRRPDAATVSRTTIDVDRRGARMQYEDLLLPIDRASSHSSFLPLTVSKPTARDSSAR
jgi:Transport and Golgi organisation 2